MAVFINNLCNAVMANPTQPFLQKCTPSVIQLWTALLNVLRIQGNESQSGHRAAQRFPKMRHLLDSNLFRSCLMAALLLFTNPAHTQTERWYQVEISIFTNEYSNLMQEHWAGRDQERPQVPADAVELRTLMDFLNLDDWSDFEPLPVAEFPEVSTPAVVDPQPLRSGNFRLPDFERDAFLLLPATESNFSDTNRTLIQSPAHRLLFNAVWRQPVQQAANAVPLRIQAGNELNGGHELEGSITIRFNPAENRVVLDSGLWFNMPDNNGTVLDLAQSREMRSDEFHYLDHPAVGILVMVFSYERPELPMAFPMPLR
jgi:hypothetical protein